MVLVKIFRLVYFFLLSKFGLQRLFGDFVNGNLAFLHDILFLSNRCKNGHFWTKTMSYPLWKYVNFSTFWTSCFYSLERCFLVLEYRKRHVPCLYCLNKDVGKMAIFGPKPWVNPFWKISIFRRFELLVFIAQKGAFPLKNIVTDISLPILPKKKCWKNGHFWTNNGGLSPLEKCQFFDF